MKPKTKLESKVVAANGQLQPIGQEPVDWAFKHCVEHMAFRTPSGMTTCMDCGHQWRNDTNNKKMPLPSLSYNIGNQGHSQKKLQRKDIFLCD